MLALFVPPPFAAATEREPLTPFTGGIAEYAAPASRDVKVVRGARAGVASHHGLASREIAVFYESLRASAGDNIKHVIIIGPNHFRSGRGAISVCPAGWDVGGVSLAADGRALRLLTNAGASAETMPFRLEHSVGVHVDFVSRYFPKATVTAMIVKNSAAERELAKVVPILSKLLDERTLLILSMDFSHGKLPSLADAEDDKSVKAIAGFDTAALRGLDIDAASAACIFLKTLEGRGITQATTLLRANSSEIAGTPNKPCTSYAFMLFSNGQ